MVIATAVLDTHNHNVNHSNIVLKNPVFQDSLEQYGLINPKQLIGEALHRRVEAIDHEMCEPGDEDTFFVADLGDVYRQHIRWKKNLPRVRPFYGRFLLPNLPSLRCLLTYAQRSSATPTLRSLSSSPSLALVLIVPPRPRSNRSFLQASAPIASSTLNPARPTPTSDTSSLWVSRR